MTIALAAAALALPACRVSGLVFNCSTDSECGPGGSCVDGYCAFPNAVCASGLKWDTSAGPFAGQCVDVSDMGTADNGDMAGGDDMSGPTSDMAHVPTWTRHAMIPTSGQLGFPAQIWGSSTTDLYVLAQDNSNNHGSIWHSTDGINWTEQFVIPTAATTGALFSIWGSGQHNIYVVGPSYYLHSTGDGTWTSFVADLPSGTNISSANTIWGADINNFYVSGLADSSNNAFVFHQSSSGQTSEKTPGAAIGRIWGNSSTDVYGLFGFTQTIWHTTGNGTWTNEGMIAVTPYSVWGSSATDVYVAGNSPDSNNMTYTNSIYHSTNGTWTAAPQLTFSNGTAQPAHLTFVYGTGPNDVYAGSPVYHSTGNGTWTLYSTLNSMNDTLASMWAASPSQIFAVATAQDGISSPIIWIYQ
jgi:hypothetical protein